MPFRLAVVWGGNRCDGWIDGVTEENFADMLPEVLPDDVDSLRLQNMNRDRDDNSFWSVLLSQREDGRYEYQSSERTVVMRSYNRRRIAAMMWKDCRINASYG